MIRKIQQIEGEWLFTKPGQSGQKVTLPHTWNAIDGQDGGNDYWRGTCQYETVFDAPEYEEGQRVYLEFCGVNASASVTLNGQHVCNHDGGYSTFRTDVTEYLKQNNHLEVSVDNSVNKTVYPQKADFTFYGGIYRDVNLIVVSKQHFDMDYFGGNGMKVTARPKLQNGEFTGKADAVVHVETFLGKDVVDNAEIQIEILDEKQQVVAKGIGSDCNVEIQQANLWHGIKAPNLYTAVAKLLVKGEVVDEVCHRFGIRNFRFDPKEGFFLNGQSYPLRGVSRHQDRKGLGNAITKKDHLEDFKLIQEVGANTIRLAHYQHDQYFYDLCDEYGFVVWAEIPYISEHMVEGRENTISQMKELIVQNYHHACIVTWGVSNEITISTKEYGDMMDNHKTLNDLCHEMDTTRPTTLAVYAVCPMFKSVVHKASDIVGYNLYLGWYVPGLWLNDLFLGAFKLLYPNRCLCYSEYGAEGMPNLHAEHPRRGDHTEEYQFKYHKYMLECFKRFPNLWATYVWNMFDFAADARNQGGEPGMNHKGLVTFDRKTKKDSFYVYKAWWSDEPFVHICGKRFLNRSGKKTTIQICTNQKRVTLYNNGQLIAEKTGDKVFTFKVDMYKQNDIIVKAGNLTDKVTIFQCDKPDPMYKLKKGKSDNWV